MPDLTKRRESIVIPLGTRFEPFFNKPLNENLIAHIRYQPSNGCEMTLYRTTADFRVDDKQIEAVWTEGLSEDIPAWGMYTLNREALIGLLNQLRQPDLVHQIKQLPVFKCR